VGLADIIKKKLFFEVGRLRQFRKVFSVFIELTQNINQYSAERDPLNGTDKGVGTGIIIVSEGDDSYTITSGNLVENAQLAQIRDHCDRIKTLDSEGLKKLYKEQIKRPRESGRKGAGVGLIDIARKSRSRLKYKINSIDEHHSFFELAVNIKKENDIGKADTD